MSRKLIFTLIAVLGLTITLDSCASSRKCDGRKGTKTPMGKM
jgi:hypothetical protein